MADIYDMYGNVVKKPLLRVEQAAPTMTGVRSVINENVSHGLTPYKLANILRDADNGHIAAYLNLAEEIEEKEPHYHAVLGTRKRSVSQLDITVEAAGDDKKSLEQAEFIQNWLDRDYLEDELVDILDAIGKGFSVTEIMWDMTGSKWLPKSLKWRDPSWFEFDRESQENIFLKTDTGLQPLNPYKFIVHRHKAKSGITTRGGVIRPVLWMYLFKNFSLKDWVIFLEAYGQPIRVGKYGAGASDDDKRVLLRAVANIGSDAAAIIPENMQIDFVEAQNKSQTTDGFKDLCAYVDKLISKVVLGQTMTTDDGSSRSQAEVHQEVKHDIERSDAKQLGATLNLQLVQPMINLNYGPQEKYPRIKIGRSENVDIEKIINVADKSVRMGLAVSAKDIREKIGFKMPESEDDILKLPSPAEPSAQNSEDVANQSKKSDPVTNLANAALDEWEEVLSPIQKLLQEATAASSSYEEFQQKILELAPDYDLEAVAEHIAKANFTANLIGQIDYKE